jgi:DNA-binding response OmpR family regulator
MKAGPFVLDLKKQTLYKNDEAIEITSKEYSLLYVFFNNQGQLLTREQLIEDAFGADYDGFDRNIDSYIKKIRQKIEDNTRSPRFLKTKYGAGYIFGGDLHDA